MKDNNTPILGMLTEMSNAIGHTVTYLEVIPSQLQGDTFITAIARDPSIKNKTLVKLEKLSKINISNNTKEKQFTYVPINDEAMWVTPSVIQENALQRAMTICKRETFKEKTFYLAIISYREEGNYSTTYENKVCLTKKSIIHEAATLRRREDIKDITLKVKQLDNASSTTNNKSIKETKTIKETTITKQEKPKKLSPMDLMGAEIVTSETY